MRVIGLAGWSGAGKTTLVSRLVPELAGRGVRVSTIKRSHHDIDWDHPGKDSQVHRQAGAREVLVSSPARWALVHEVGGEGEPRLADLLRRLGPADVVLVEGFRREPFAKIEVHRLANGKPFLHADDPAIVAVVTDDRREPWPGPPRLDPDATGAIADLVLDCAEPLAAVLARLSPATREIA